MHVLFLFFAVLLTFMLAIGWLLVLLLPWLSFTAAAAGGVARHREDTRHRRAAKGILHIGVPEPALYGRLRSPLARTLALAAPDTRPRACACIKESATGSLGVLRIFNSQGHFLLQASGESAAAVAGSITDTLDGFTDAFPVEEGSRRVEIPECDPKTCPLRQRALTAA